jgi:ribosomal protein S18 acetylase RimI-like enzyme
MSGPDQITGNVPKDIDPLRARCRIILFDRNTMKPDDIAQNIAALHTENFGMPHGIVSDKLFNEPFKKTAYENILYLLQEDQTCLELIQDGEKIVGYCLALPIGRIDSKRASERNETAYIMNTEMDRVYQGHRIVEDVMDVMETELRKRGYKYIERDAITANGYAEKIKRHYGERIISENGPHQSKIGAQTREQMFFRIKL